jgi:signal transduction histidine kinase
LLLPPSGGKAPPTPGLTDPSKDVVRELVESINHHLRTPLAAILGHTDLLLDHRSDLPGQVQDSLAGILRAGARLEDVVTSICDLVDVACGCPGQLASVDVSELLAREVDACGAAATARDVRLLLDGTGDVVCAAYPERLRSAIRALLENAIAYAPCGSVVHATATSAATGVRIAVRGRVDVPLAGQEPAAELFGRIALTQDAEIRAGLGLALAGAVASRHGGRMVLLEIPAGGLETRLELATDPTRDADRTAHRPG